jgi:cell division protein FtsL
MLQAENTYARDWSVTDLPEVVRTRRLVRKTKVKINQKRKLLIKGTAILFGYALLLVFLCIKSSILGYQIEQMGKDVQDLETANQRLEYQIAQKSSLDRVERIAVANLGMCKPDLNKSIAMEVKAEPVKVATTVTSASNDMSISQKVLNNLFSSLSRLAQNTK